jgi:hypothetical protein
MDNSKEISNHLWGMKINDRLFYEINDYPKWANRSQRESWQESGLILWDATAKTITRLWAAQALEILDYLVTTNDWRQLGLIVSGEQTRLPMKNSDDKTVEIRYNEVCLTPTQLLKLFDYLQQAKDRLEQIKEQDQKRRREALRKVYAILLNLPKKHNKDDSV